MRVVGERNDAERGPQGQGAQIHARTTLQRQRGSGSFGRNEIPLALWCLQKAFDHIIEEGNTRSDENSIEEEIIS